MKPCDAVIYFELTSSSDEYMFTGRNDDGVYTIRTSKTLNGNWYFSLCDFIEYCDNNHLNGKLLVSEKDLSFAKAMYGNHHYNDSLRQNELPILIHSTTAENWQKIKSNGKLKSRNQLKKESGCFSEPSIGEQLGDPDEFSDYIMFGSGVTGEIVVASKQCGFINMDINTEYQTGARLYFDAEQMAADGLLLRDGAHIKVKDEMPLEPYLVWAATWDSVGLESAVATPKEFATAADLKFKKIYRRYV